MSAPGYVPNTAQRRLAEEVTRFVHGPEGLQQALNATEVRDRRCHELCARLTDGSSWIWFVLCHCGLRVI